MTTKPVKTAFVTLLFLLFYFACAGMKQMFCVLFDLVRFWQRKVFEIRIVLDHFVQKTY